VGLQGAVDERDGRGGFRPVLARRGSLDLTLEEEGGGDQEGEEEVGKSLAARVVEEGGHGCSPVWCSYPMGEKKT
jgi:hypothetical protein